MSKPKIGVIVATTREKRFADKPVDWLMEKVEDRDDMTFEKLDLRDFDLPFFDEAASNLHAPSKDPKAMAWQNKLSEFDGFIVVTAEYNHSIPGALKNALDQAYKEWVRKPMAAFGYGGVGGARAVEHLRMIAVELQMVPVRNAVHLGAGAFFKVSPMGEDKPMSEVEEILSGSLKGMLDDLHWWAKATMAARAADEE